ncbi:MAG TPA: hypothetical protein VKU61_07540 [Candidatus Binatia bacterium]|nr:hypothetical protein [Candidatus Binatia bacterium]
MFDGENLTSTPGSIVNVACAPVPEQNVVPPTKTLPVTMNGLSVWCQTVSVQIAPATFIIAAAGFEANIAVTSIAPTSQRG